MKCDLVGELALSYKALKMEILFVHQIICFGKIIFKFELVVFCDISDPF